jgi:hypothetical protein
LPDCTIEEFELSLSWDNEGMSKQSF